MAETFFEKVSRIKATAKLVNDNIGFKPPSDKLVEQVNSNFVPNRKATYQHTPSIKYINNLKK